METMWHESIRDDVLKWVMFSFPWGQPGTRLENYPRPRKWQCEEMNRMTAHIRRNKFLVLQGKPPEVYKFSMASGRGVGKSAFVAMITLWFMSTVIGGSAILSANNDTQLSSKTFGEIGKWKTLCISGYWFEMLQKKLIPEPWYSKSLQDRLGIDTTSYYAEGVLWNEDNVDAFAGAHNTEGMLLIFDEASGIPTAIWDASIGFFTEKSIYRFWLNFGNPRRNTGAFFDCFHDDGKNWITRNLDAREAEVEDVEPLVAKAKQLGEDSDWTRVEVRGQFPAQGDRQFISRGIIFDAVRRDLITDHNDIRFDRNEPLLIGCDPARFGSDATVIRFRQGRDAKSIQPIELIGADNMKVANTLAKLIDETDPDAVFIDSGAGAGIIDRLREMQYKVYEVGFGTAAEDVQWADHRTELWARMRDWLIGAMIDDHDKLRKDLAGPEYEYTGKGHDRLKLESKDSMRKRQMASPDHADALALTFHAKIARKDLRTARNSPGARRRPVIARNDLR